MQIILTLTKYELSDETARTQKTQTDKTLAV